MQGAATSLSEMGEYIAAGKFFELAGRTNNMPQFYMNAGLTYSRGSDWEASISAYKKCLKLSQQQFLPCHMKLAWVYRY